MKIAEILQVTNNKLASLRGQYAQAIHDGELELVASLEDQIAETETTIVKLETIQ